MKSILLCILLSGYCCIATAQNNIITTSVNSFCFYDGKPLQISHTSQIPFILNLSYERLAGDFGIRAAVGGYDLVYEANEKGELGRRQFALIVFSLRRYLPISDRLYLFPALHLSFRMGEEEWYVRDDPYGHFFEQVIYSDPGIGGGLGIQYELFDRIILEFETGHTFYWHNTENDPDLLTGSDSYDGLGSKQQLSFSLAAGVLF